MMHGQANIRYEIYLLIKYTKSVHWRVVKRLSYIEEAQCLKVKVDTKCVDSEKCRCYDIVQRKERISVRTGNRRWAGMAQSV